MDENAEKDVLSTPASAEEILLDGEKVEGFLIKPWTLSKCAEVSPILEKIYLELKKRKLTFRDFVHVTKNEEGKDKIEVINLDQLYFSITPFTPAVIALTLGITAEEVDKIKPDSMFPIIICILRQNIGYIKNSVALMTSMVQAISKLSV
jgi:hypothetical protein